MDIGVPAEIKIAERRVGLTPAAVGELVNRGHHVNVETGAGDGAGFSDVEYKEAGAAIVGTADDVFANSEMIVKVKEPLAPERARLESHHTLFTYLHLAADLPQTEDLLNSGAACIAYETVTDDAGRLPLLAPMSAIAGRMSIQAGAHALEATQGGAGLLLGGVPGVRPGKVVIIGGGVVGENAAEMAVGLGADGADWHRWLVLAMVGVMTTIAMFCFVRGFTVGEASILGPMEYIRLVYATALGYVFFAEVPGPWTWVGSVIIIGSAFYIARNEAFRLRGGAGS
mgnify:CR=1 FL=1